MPLLGSLFEVNSQALAVLVRDRSAIRLSQWDLQGRSMNYTLCHKSWLGLKDTGPFRGSSNSAMGVQGHICKNYANIIRTNESYLRFSGLVFTRHGLSSRKIVYYGDNIQLTMV